MTTEPLTDREQAILTFERQWWKFAGAKEEKIREQFAMTATRYYQVLNSLLERPEAAAYAPSVVNRLRRLKDRRADERSSRALGFDHS